MQLHTLQESESKFEGFVSHERVCGGVSIAKGEKRVWESRPREHITARKDRGGLMGHDEREKKKKADMQCMQR